MPQESSIPKTSVSAREFAEGYKVLRQDAMFHALMAFVFAVAQILTVYLILSLVYNTPVLDSLLGMAHDASLPRPVAILLSRGFLQPLNLIVFAFAANTLAIRFLLMYREFHAFSHSYFADIPVDSKKELSIGENERNIPYMNIQQIAKDYSGSLPLLVRRIEIGSRRLAEGGDAAEIHDVMKALSDIDSENLQSRFTLVRYLIWLIPTIGFLGTVIGIGLSITQFSDVMSQFGVGAENFQTRLQVNLSNVATSLGVAFDTTMLALLLSSILVAMTSIIQTREESLLSSIDEFCLRHFVSHISVPNASACIIGQVTVGLMSMAQGIERLGKRITGKGEQDGMTLRDIAGLIEGQTERIKKAVIECGGKGVNSAAAAKMEKLVNSVAQSAQKIQETLRNSEAHSASAQSRPAKPPES